MDINSYEDSVGNGGPPANTSPLLSASGKKYYGLGNPTKSSEVNLSMSSVYHNKYGKQPPNYASRICTTIWLSIIFIIVAGLITAFAVFHHLPDPSVTTTQGVLQGNTVPLYLTNKQELPRSINTYWYLSVSVHVASESLNSKVNQGLSLVFYEADHACHPLPDHNDTLEWTERNKTFDKLLPTLSYQYLTSDDEIRLTTRENIDQKITAYVLDNHDSYKCFTTSGTGTINATACGYVQTHTLTANGTLTFSPTIPSYYFVILVSEDTATLDYTQQVSLHYFNITDYDILVDTQSCDVNVGSKQKSCSFDLDGRKGCLFVYGTPSGTETDVVEYVPLIVKVEHNIWNLPGLCCLAVGVALLIMTFSVVLLKYGCYYIMKH